jgi:ATP-dependent RNA helicase DeaD
LPNSNFKEGKVFNCQFKASSLRLIKSTALTTFSELGVSEASIKALNENNIFEPTEIQEKAIPFLLQTGTDLIAQAQTGTGKTAAFGLPLIQKVNADNPAVQALILCPTRELGQQIAKQIFRFARYTPKRIYVEAVYGGAYIGDQIKALQRPTQILVATPGRLIDLLEKKAVELSQVKTIVLDEADEMLSMGFKKELDSILSQTQGKRSTWLFSATMPVTIQSIIKNYMTPDAFRIQIDKNNIVNKNIDHRFAICEPKEKLNSLIQFLKIQGDNRGMVFCVTKANAQLLAKQLFAKNISAEALHGDLLQKERDKVMRAFKKERLQLLIATDIAARGLDVNNLSFVVHYEIPDQIEYYTHRSGRTARAGKKGMSLSLISNKELKNLQEIESALKIEIKEYNL